MTSARTRRIRHNVTRGDGAERRLLRSVLPVWAAWLGGVILVLAAGAVLGIIGGAGDRPQGFLWPLFSWDFDLYRYVSVHGYIEGDTPAYAFFPLWPLVLAVGGWPLAAAVVVGATAAAFLGVAALTESPRRTAVALACWPGSFALALAYPDGLALAAAAWACALATRPSDILLLGNAIGALGALAAVARPAGFLVALPLFLLGRRWAALAPLVAAAAVHGYFWWRDGDPGAFFRAQSHWGRGGIEPFVVIGVLVLAVLLWRRRLLPLYTVGVAAMVAAAGSLQTRVEALRLGLVALPALRLLRSHVWIAYSVAVLALSLGSGSIQSLGRQSLLAFPLIWAAADRAPGWLLALGALANATLLLLLPQFAP